jgi:tetratricopeptide (TPR) repeat protein
MVQTTQITLRDRVQQIEDAISAGQLDDAMNACQHILAHYPDALEIQRLLGEVYLAQGRMDEARQTFDWILVNDPENMIVYCDRALICEQNSDIDTALDCYQQAYELSRGNAQIRQEFNNLSARAGQQEFMLSRAGLARLYMRGHLFTQAEYEWEAVLAVSPERLDARLGLLETYWREGKYEEVEPLATRILEEVPQCLKALLLLAHVVSAYNMPRAQSLIERAVRLDPELFMAQDLFSEYATSQPNDPFLALIRRAPLELTYNERNRNGKAPETINTRQYASIDIEADAPDIHASGEHIYDWDDKSNWSTLDAHSTPPQASTASSEHPAASPTPATTNNAPAQNEPIDDFETWASQQEIDDDFDPALLEKQPWFQAEQASAPQALDIPDRAVSSLDSSSPGVSEQVSLPASTPESATTFSETDLPAVKAEAQEHIESWLPQDDPWNTFASAREEPDAPPAWLDMLTTFEQRTERPAASPKPAAPAPSVSPQIEPKKAWQPPAEHDDDDMGWPAWLKSLGAEVLEPESQAQIEQSPQMTLPGDEASLVTTLETLEENLRSQGFVPLQPGSLSAIAQETPRTAPTTSPLAELAEPPAPESNHETPAAQAPDAPATVAPLTSSVPSQVEGAPTEQASLPEVPRTTYQPEPAPTLDMLLDNELETTMRRPALRLPAGPSQTGQLTKGIDYSQKSADGTLTHKERLVHGYQLQLAGAYDEAMQEYRWLIRNSPESLGEVISNVRALLKLVPKYTAGYRVLGDAYMRQGEYLQAMEAYNKALTIAKKTKSQGR